MSGILRGPASPAPTTKETAAKVMQLSEREISGLSKALTTAAAAQQAVEVTMARNEAVQVTLMHLFEALGIPPTATVDVDAGEVYIPIAAVVEETPDGSVVEVTVPDGSGMAIEDIPEADGSCDECPPEEETTDDPES